MTKEERVIKVIFDMSHCVADDCEHCSLENERDCVHVLMSEALPYVELYKEVVYNGEPPHEV